VSVRTLSATFFAVMCTAIILHRRNSTLMSSYYNLTKGVWFGLGGLFCVFDVYS